MSEVSLLKQLTRSLMAGLPIANQDPHRQKWHVMPAIGALNDPNGFIQAHGRYHLFHQWNPLTCGTGASWWAHLSSTDLVTWQHEPVALLPTEDYEINGCYSGSAVLKDDKIHLLYTGNVKFKDGSRTAWQCLAIEQADGTYEKQGPVIALPEGYTGHVRDPKVWQHDDFWYMVLAAQAPDLQGKILLYRSPDLTQWELLNELAGSCVNQLAEFGYMWECPDLFRLGNADILLCCPQGLAAKEYEYLNLYQAGYFIGELDYQTHRYQHGSFHEMDLGFEFYAPQTTETEDGRRLMFGWLGLPDDNRFAQPTVQYGWVDCLTCPRELIYRDGQLYQTPVSELKALRSTHELNWSGLAENAPALDAMSSELHVDVSSPFSLSFRENASLKWDGQQLIFTRLNWRTQQEESRYWFGELDHLQILLDASSIEIFINHGEACMSARYFPSAQKTQMKFDGAHPVSIRHWLLHSPMLECPQPTSSDVP